MCIQLIYNNLLIALETSFEVGLNMTNVEWTDDLYNTSSAAYQELLAKFIAEVSYLPKICFRQGHSQS